MLVVFDTARGMWTKLGLPRWQGVGGRHLRFLQLRIFVVMSRESALPRVGSHDVHIPCGVVLHRHPRMDDLLLGKDWVATVNIVVTKETYHYFSLDIVVLLVVAS